MVDRPSRLQWILRLTDGSRISSTFEEAQKSSVASRYPLRVLLSREIQVDPPVRDLIYELGAVSSAVREDLEELVRNSNASEGIQQLCAQIRQTSATLAKDRGYK